MKFYGKTFASCKAQAVLKLGRDYKGGFTFTKSNGIAVLEVTL